MSHSPTSAPADSTSLSRELQAGIDRGAEFLLARIGADGHPGARHCHYYRVPWALALSGHRFAASRVLSWVERTALADNGDLRAGPARTGFETHWSTYPLANLATGAWHLERYDTAHRLADRLAAYQHPEGGALAAHPDHRTDQRQDLFPTAQLGMTGLTTGHLDLAHGAYNWMRLLYAAQPELPHRLYSATDGRELITDTGDDERLAWQVVTDFTQPRQAFYNPGIAAAFLGRYHMATGEPEALSLARDYLALTVTGTETQFDHTDSVQVCKFAWGASVLYEATGEREYLDYMVRMARWFLTAQNEDGSWDNSPFLMARADHPPSVRIEVTAEFVQHLISILTALGSQPRTRAGVPPR